MQHFQLQVLSIDSQICSRLPVCRTDCFKDLLLPDRDICNKKQQNHVCYKILKVFILEYTFMHFNKQFENNLQ